MKNTTSILVSVVILLSLITIPCTATNPDNEKVSVIIGFKDKTDVSLVKAFGGDIKEEYTIIPAIAADIPVKALNGLSMNPNIEIVEYDAQAHTMGQVVPWGIDRIEAPEVHSTYTGDGVKVAIIDSGVDYNHPDLAGNYKGGYDYANRDKDPMDNRGHGTHVAGTVLAINNEIGVLGVAPSADLYALKVVGSDGLAYYSDIISALQWAAKNDMDVASMSLGGGPDSFLLERACNRAYESGVVLVAAAGNENGAVGYPAAYESVIAVSATDEENHKASFSNYGEQIELAAPGVNINSTIIGGGYSGDTWDGTSMATPHVTGTVALLLNTAVPTDYDTNGNGMWDPVEVRQRLWDTAFDLGASGKDDYFGYGLVNATAAVDFGTPGPTPEPPLEGYMYVQDITMATDTKPAGSNTFVWATATVKIVNETGVPVSGATVTGSWIVPISSIDTGTTDTDGAATLKSNSVKNPESGSIFTFNVINVVHAYWEYNATANIITTNSTTY